LKLGFVFALSRDRILFSELGWTDRFRHFPTASLIFKFNAFRRDSLIIDYLICGCVYGVVRPCIGLSLYNSSVLGWHAGTPFLLGATHSTQPPQSSNEILTDKTNCTISLSLLNFECGAYVFHKMGRGQAFQYTSFNHFYGWSYCSVYSA
jgi:hypothetical protein